MTLLTVGLIGLRLFMEPFTARAQGKPADQLKNKYSQIEVARFETKNGVDVPVEYLDALTKDLVNELRAIKKFKQVYSPSDNSQRASATTLKLIGQVTMFQPGSRLKRFLVGWGAGKTKIVAQIKIEDGTTKELLYEKTADGKVLLGGVLMGASIGATRGLAKEVAKGVAGRFF